MTFINICFLCPHLWPNELIIRNIIVQIKCLYYLLNKLFASCTRFIRPNAMRIHMINDRRTERNVFRIFRLYTKFTSILAPMRCSAIIVFTALIHRFLMTYRFSLVFVMDNSVFKADVMSHGCFRASCPDKRLLEINFCHQNQLKSNGVKCWGHTSALFAVICV